MDKPFYKLTPREMKDYFQRFDAKQKRKILMFIGAGLVLIPFVIWPAWIVRWQNQAKIKSLDGQIKSAEIQIQLEPKLLAEETHYESFIEEAHARLFTDTELQRLLGILNELAQRSKVTILSSQPQANETFSIPEPYQKKYGARSYMIAVEGGYHALATFVSEIENYTKPIRVDQFSITIREETPENHLGEVLLSVFIGKD